MLDLTHKLLSKEKENTLVYVNGIIESEQGYIFTNDYSYYARRGKTMRDDSEFDPEQMFINDMRQRINQYFALVVRNVKDTIPKLIGHFLVKKIQEQIKFELYDAINNSQEIVSLLGEPEHIRVERETIQRTLEILEKA